MTAAGEDIGRHARQERLPQVGPEGQRRLAAARVAIVGIGATGTHLAELLGRAGVGRGRMASGGGADDAHGESDAAPGFLRLIDRDVVELSNLQRQGLFVDADAHALRPKAAAAAEALGRIDPDLNVEPCVEDLTADNAARLLNGVDLVLDGTDNFPTRFLVNDWCVQQGVPFIYTGSVGTEGQSLVITESGPCLRCYVPEPPPPGALPTCDTAGVLGSAVTLIVSLSATEALKLLLGAADVGIGEVAVADAWTGTVRRLRLPREPECPCCVGRRFTFLDEAPAATATVLCGRDAVQLPSESGAVDLPALARTLANEGEVREGPFMLRLDLSDERRVLIFKDGRTIIGGTDDPAEARTLRAKLLGT